MTLGMGLEQLMDEVLIIGAGPVGLSLAVDLTSRGIPVVVFEQDQQIVKEIRASTFHAATMEKMEEWGVLDAVLARGHRVDHLQFWDRRERKIVGDFDYSAIAADTKFPFRLQCPQHVYAETLLERLQREPLATIHFGHEFLSSREGRSGIEAKFETSRGVRSYSGRLLCGADGANSALRRSLGLSFDGMTYEDRFLLIGTDLDLSRYYPGMASVSYIFDPDEWVITLQLNELLRIVFQVADGQDGEVELSDDNIRRRVWKFIGEEIDFPILHKSIYRVHQRVADTFRVGRCLLLGDAAHINNPASGMGMNSGILDAHCLGEKISEYLTYERDEALDGYSTLRRSYALDKIRGYTRQRYQDLSAADVETRQQRNQQYEAISRDPQRARDFLLRAAMLEHRI
jgi:3-(3-hydroxy-phenyl)propionate hydroxylase